MNEPSHHVSTLDYDHIADGIYVGNNQCCQMHFDQQLLKGKEITADISLEEDRLDEPFGIECYLWLPVADHTPPSHDQLCVGVSSLNEFVRLKKKVYLHCRNGHGRAPTMMAAYLIRKGASLEEALMLIKERRPSIHITDVQMAALRVFAQ